MKKIAILTCLNACKVCTGASCLHAWNEKIKSFERYRNEDVQLAAFMHCNGCGTDPETDAGMAEKIERLEKISVSVVHTGVCTVMGRPQEERRVCPSIVKITEMLKSRGIEIVSGTH